jgi:mono/diheme cytochrome c family protein
LTGLARQLRKTGRPDLARATLQPFLTAAEHSSTFAVEMACIELDAGDYERATTWLEQASPQDLAEHTTLSAAGIALAMLGDTPRAARAFQWIADEMSAVTLLHDMELDPTHEELAREFQQLMSTLSARREQPGLFDAAFAQDDASDNVSPGMRLYNTHCEACHGREGRGDGRAARHLHPTPRDLRLDKMRLVSGDSGIPTRNDVANVIRLGVPGTAMQPLPELRDPQVEQLVDVVIDMRRSGLREAFLAEMAAEGEPVDERDIAALVDAQTVTGQPADVPDHRAADPESVARGALRYVEQSCHSCHGEDGTGAPTQMLFDDLGQPCATRDLALDPLKGGNTAKAVYLRILLGMPGSPHPATVNLAPDAMSDLVHFCQSLGKEPKQQLTNHARALRAALQ